MFKLLIATTNQGKVHEYRYLLKGLPLKLVNLAEEGIDLVVDEKGVSFEENASLKALSYARLSHLPTLADDSGLEVDSLNGEPGVRSARFAGENVSDKDKVEYLLSKLNQLPWEKRTAHFTCVIAVATPEGEVRLCHGECHGLIAFEAKGDNGFGYDPIFYLPEFDKTMAELAPEIKNQVSHRARAAFEARQILEQLAEKVRP